MVRPVFPALAALALATAPLAAQTAPPVAGVTAAAPLALTPEQSAKMLPAGKKYIGWFLAMRADSLATAMTPETLKALGGIDGISEWMTRFVGNAGGQTGEPIAQKMTRRNGYPQFWHEAVFSAAPDDGVVVIRFVLDADAKIIGFGANPRSRAPAPDA